MNTGIKDNEVKGNVVTVGLVNNVVQSNIDASTNLTNEFKFGPIKFLQAWWGNKVLDYITNYELKKQECLNLINEKALKQIPQENIENPRINIVGPVLDNLKYNLDENHIKEMFINILVNEMDNRKQNKILPAYVAIINQLGKDDAEFIFNIFNSQPISEIYVMEEENKLKYILLKNKQNNIVYFKVSNITLDNLDRLGIIKNQSLYELILDDDYIEYRKVCEEILKNKNAKYSLTDISITEFGKNFIDICCS